MPRRIESLFIAGPAGRLEALIEEPEHTDPTFAALVCHPHPQFGGTMHNKVVYRMARGMRTAGGVALRFNYRGVNRSEGSYDEGRGETEDARACLDWLRRNYPSLPYLLAGFSFGARLVQRLGCATNGVERVIVVGLPTSYLDKESFDECAVPRIFIQSTHDQYGPRERLQPFVDQLGERAGLIWIEASDHFFAGGLDALEDAIIQAGRRSKYAVPSFDSSTHSP
jgi:alpha/beta superfamily hydrolase